MVNRQANKAEAFRMRGLFPENSVLLAFSGSFVLRSYRRSGYIIVWQNHKFLAILLWGTFLGVVFFSVTSAFCWSNHRMEIIDAIGGNGKDGMVKAKQIDI